MFEQMVGKMFVEHFVIYYIVLVEIFLETEVIWSSVSFPCFQKVSPNELVLSELLKVLNQHG